MQLTLDQVLGRLHEVHNLMTTAQRNLATARDAEVTALEAERLAVARATTSPDCPRPKRGENGVTVADRDAWVDLQTADERLAARVATAVRESHADNLRVVRDQASVVQSLSSLMRAEMQFTATPGAP